MPPAYNNDLKWRIIYLHYDGYSLLQIANLLYISQGLVKKVLRLYKKWGTAVNPWQQVRGRHKTFNQSDMKGYGYSEINSRAVKKVVFLYGKRYTLLPALTLDGIIAVDVIEGSYTKTKFKEL
ncbi:hypothetical protein C2G38_2221949 [Gigaspora rosea]|uniref:Paired domain-containing protein n=1 Tax=Gigaspora rosea TaxID=44941 RepID=A0A397U6B7_9GLOM|nr:hypothetical protein C2G38_2221949 [Gigaspora rosea]